MLGEGKISLNLASDFDHHHDRVGGAVIFAVRKAAQKAGKAINDKRGITPKEYNNERAKTKSI